MPAGSSTDPRLPTTFDAYSYSAWRRLESIESLYERRKDPITGHTDAGWSVNGSPASIEASSITHAPSSGPVCLPLLSLIVW